MGNMWLNSVTSIYLLNLSVGSALQCNGRTDCKCCVDEKCSPNRYHHYPYYCENGCIDGYRGAQCYVKCPDNCKACTRNYHANCTKCHDGYFLGANNDCKGKCSENCKTCNSTSYCSECKERFYGITCEIDCSVGCLTAKCSLVTGECKCLPDFTGFKCEDCVASKYGTFCNNSCPLQCMDRLCGNDSGYCTNGCTNSNIIGLKCMECVDGWSGELCDKECPKNCEVKDRICRNGSGLCLACRGNFSGRECNICKPGFYGVTCDLSCSEQCFSSSCVRLTGKCEAGCKGHYSGDKCCVPNYNCINCESNFKCNKCESGYYGYSCEKRCPIYCAGSCNATSGICDACQYGYYGSLCEQECQEACGHASAENPCRQATGMCKFGCKIGAYGLTCNKTCSKYCIDDVCRQETGVCVKGCNSSSKMFVCTVPDPICTVNCTCCKNQLCGPGRYFEEGTCTKGCIDGYRGQRCYMKCIFNCTECKNTVNRCTACYKGFYPGPNYDCTSKCPLGCETCTSGSTCTKCKDYYHNADNSTDCPYTYCTHKCKCQKTKCMSCLDGYYDISTSCSRRCPDNCASCSSEETCDKCKDGYYNGNALDNTTLSQFGNCSKECRVNCTQCSSYETCLKCAPGRYGSTCNEVCSAGCKTKECSIDSGECSCAPNFTGDNCKECKIGKFGNMCENECSSGCKNNVCEKQSGSCMEGCMAESIIGKACNACLDGRYGEFCNTSCPPNCKGKKCDRDKGTCIACPANYAGELCQRCENGKYGEGCEHICPDRCAGDVCLRYSGKCVSCNGNFKGDRCGDCKRSFFGPQCNDKCSKYCFDYLCDRNTGVCMHGCKMHFSGDKCCLRSSNCLKCLTNDHCEECKIGFYGSKCNMSCSEYCVDNVCMQATGICTKGCNDTFDIRLCPVESDMKKEKSEGDNESVVAVMGGILAISVAVNITVGIVLTVRKVRSGRRAHKDEMEVAFKKDMPSLNEPVDLAIQNAEATAVEDDTVYYNIKEETDRGQERSKTSKYEAINREQVAEHEYENPLSNISN